MTELWLVRHGQTDWNIAGRYQGQADIPLNEAGIQQANQAATKLVGKTFSALYSSDLSRAYRTAKIISISVGLPVRIDQRLREINQGAWEGLNYKQVVARFSPKEELSIEDITNERAPGGESIYQVAERMKLAADDIAAQHNGDAVLVVSHGLAIATLICLANQYPLHTVYEHIIGNAEPAVIQWTL
jgi:broad specificity phosphatase PhoE